MQFLRSSKHKPTHPGAILREAILPELGITQAEFADRLDVSRRTISEILHEHRPVTPDMALRLARFLGTTPASWLNMQQALDVWKLEHENTRVYAAIEKYA